MQLAGLDPHKRYRVRELNLYPGTTSTLPADATYSGDFLMQVDFNPGVTLTRTSVALELTAGPLPGAVAAPVPAVSLVTRPPAHRHFVTRPRPDGHQASFSSRPGAAA